MSNQNQAVLALIGQQALEIAVLKGQLAQARQMASDLVCPDPAKHNEKGDMGEDENSGTDEAAQA